MENIFYLGLIMFAGLIVAKLAGYFKLPDVTGYLLAGILIGPSLLGLVPKENILSLEVVSQLALAIIAYVTGAELKLSVLKKSGIAIIMVTFFEVFGAFLLILLAMLLFFHQSLAFSLVLGAIATATAPAATLMVIKQYKARGPMVDTLIPVVALDDGFCIMLFGICATIARSLLEGGGVSLSAMFVQPLFEIGLALLLGFVAGILTIFLLRKISSTGNLTTYVLACVFLLTYLAIRWNLSSLLVNLAFGFTVTNLSNQANKALSALDGLTAPLFLSFFVISGADLDLSVIGSVGLVGLGYILFRSLGKYLGTYVSARYYKMDRAVYLYMGCALLPQAGVAIGLALMASNIIPDPYGMQIRTIVLAATIVYELVGPLAAKWSLKKAGEIQ